MGALLIPVLGWADVTGTLTVETLWSPTQSPSYQAEERIYILDLRVHASIGVLASGLLFEVDAQLGVPGVEHTVLSASGTLGALYLKAQVAFAQPYTAISLTSSLTGLLNAFVFTVPIGPPLFVTQRVEASFTLFGVLLRNVAIFEDVNFQHPFPLPPLGGGGAVLPAYTVQSQSFRFGDILTIQGQLYNGASVALSVAINADPSQATTIKGHSFAGAVLDSEVLTFVRETIALQGWRIGPVTVSLFALFEDGQIAASGSLTYPFSSGLFSVTFASPTDQKTVIPLVPTSVSLTLTRLPLTLIASLDPLGGKITSITGSSSVALSPIASLALQVIGAPGSGVQSFTAALLVDHPSGFTVSSRASFSPSAPPVGATTVTADLTPFLQVRGTVTIALPNPQPQVLQAGLSATYRF